MFKTSFAALAALSLYAAPVLAGDIDIIDAYARSSSPNAKAGAAFMEIRNTGATADRLVAVSSDIAARVELHTHSENADGVMQMRKVEGGFEIPAKGSHLLKRGGDHVMFMGLTGPMEQGKTINVTLTFEESGDMVVEVPVDLERKPMHGEMKHNN